MTDSALYVRNKHAKTVLLYEVISPDGMGSAMRDRLGRVILVSRSGAFIGYAQWFGASAWAETELGRNRLAYKNPQGTWVWKINQPSQEVITMKAQAKVNVARVKGEHVAITQVKWTDDDKARIVALLGGKATAKRIEVLANKTGISVGCLTNCAAGAYVARRNGAPVSKSHGSLAIRSDVSERLHAFLDAADKQESSEPVKRSHHRKNVEPTAELPAETPGLSDITLDAGMQA